MSISSRSLCLFVIVVLVACASSVLGQGALPADGQKCYVTRGGDPPGTPPRVGICTAGGPGGAIPTGCNSINSMGEVCADPNAFCCAIATPAPAAPVAKSTLPANGHRCIVKRAGDAPGTPASIGVCTAAAAGGGFPVGCTSINSMAEVCADPTAFCCATAPPVIKSSLPADGQQCVVTRAGDPPGTKHIGICRAAAVGGGFPQGCTSINSMAEVCADPTAFCCAVAPPKPAPAVAVKNALPADGQKCYVTRAGDPPGTPPRVGICTAGGAGGAIPAGCNSINSMGEVCADPNAFCCAIAVSPRVAFKTGAKSKVN